MMSPNWNPILLFIITPLKLPDASSRLLKQFLKALSIELRQVHNPNLGIHFKIFKHFATKQLNASAEPRKQMGIITWNGL